MPIWKFPLFGVGLIHSGARLSRLCCRFWRQFGYRHIRGGSNLDDIIPLCSLNGLIYESDVMSPLYLLLKLLKFSHFFKEVNNFLFFKWLLKNKLFTTCLISISKNNCYYYPLMMTKEKTKVSGSVLMFLGFSKISLIWEKNLLKYCLFWARKVYICFFIFIVFYAIWYSIFLCEYKIRELIFKKKNTFSAYLKTD